ncbi:MAG: fused MFS/spermidine synthase [Alphaproteobacteria bacterium]|nr:fused MFS/spermidine synthase [Alphaproteobacteria bacterium]MCL2758143.1 fused MFS/spermidine synthase [Alphaproteobacteria bacterium]
MTRKLTLTLILLNGYVGLAMQLLALRQVSNFVGGTAAISSIIIGTYLGAMTAGYFVGTKKMPPKVVSRLVGASFIGAMLLIVLAASFPLLHAYFGFMAAAGLRSPIIQTFVYALTFLSVAPFLFGFNTAALSQNLHEATRDNTGIILGVGTIGSVMGSLFTTLIFMTLFGVNYTVMFTAALAGTAAYLAGGRRWMLFAALAVFAFAVSINNSAFLRKNFGIVSNNAISTISIQESTANRYLLVDKAIHSVISLDGTAHAEYANFINRYFIHSIPQNIVKDILILGAGGFTIGHGDLRNNYVFVDINPALQRASEEHFLFHELPPNNRFVVRDAGAFLRTTDEKFDLVVMDVFSRWSIPESAITTDFMESMKARTKPGGIIVMNIIASAMFSDEFSRRINNTIRHVFPTNLSRHLIGHFDAWGPRDYVNVIYIWRNIPNRGRIYTPDMNSTLNEQDYFL